MQAEDFAISRGGNHQITGLLVQPVDKIRIRPGLRKLGCICRRSDNQMRQPDRKRSPSTQIEYAIREDPHNSHVDGVATLLLIIEGMDLAAELRHVLQGAQEEERSRSGTDRLLFRARQPTEVLQRARAILQIVLSHQAPWPTDVQWRSLLPEWFVQSCAPEQTAEEAQRWLDHWRSLSPDLKAQEEALGPWSLSNWLYWFDPDGMGGDRGWAWWDAGVSDSSSGWVDIEVDGLPYPARTLRWLLRACGG